MSGYIVFVVALAAIAAGTLGLFWGMHLRAERRRWARYSPTRGSGESNSVVCPRCRQRSYSPRANRGHFCPNCEQHY